MNIEGKIWKDKKSSYWVVDVPLLDISTQGESKKEALTMIKGAIELEVDKKGFSVNILSAHKDSFEVHTEYTNTLVAFILKRQRQAHGLTLRDVAERMHVKSINAYAQYEQGARHPSLSVLLNLLSAIDVSLVPIFKVSHSR